jgi:MFS family permease
MRATPTGETRPADTSLTFWRYFLPFWIAFGAVKTLQILLYPDPYLISDTGEYLWSAHTFRLNPYKPFGYSLLLAGCRVVLPFPLGVAILQSVLRLGATTLLGVVLRRYVTMPRWVVLSVSLLVGLDPMALFLDHHLLSDSLFLSATVTVLAAVLAHVRLGSWWWLLLGLVAMSIAITTRFVGLVYPVLLLGVILLYPGRARIGRALAVVGVTVAIVAGTAIVNRQVFGVFRVTTFDGWALYGNIGSLIGIGAGEAASVADPEGRLLFEYFAAFPEETYRNRTADWHRWNPRSPAKELLYGFDHHSDARDLDPIAAVAVESFMTRFGALAHEPSTPAQRLYHRHQDAVRSGDPGQQPYHHAYVLVNELLRTFNREYLRRHGGEYLGTVYPLNLARVFAPRDLLSQGTYRERWEPDQAVAAFWPGADSSRWRPRMGDVAGAFGRWCPWYVSVEWFLAAVLLGWCLATRPSRPLARWKRFTALGALLFAFAVATGAAIAFSHNTQTRYLAPILPFVIVSGALCGVRPFVPWLDLLRDVSFRWTPLRRWTAVGVGAILAVIAIGRAGSVIVESGRRLTDDSAREWILARATPGALVALEGPGRTRWWTLDPRVEERLRVVGLPPSIATLGSGDAADPGGLLVDFDWVVLGADMPGSGSSEGRGAASSGELRRALVDAWGPSTAFDRDSLRGPTVWVVRKPHALRAPGADPDRFDALAGVPPDAVREFLEDLADAHLAGGESELALQVYVAATEYLPDDERGYYNLGTVALELGRYEEAIPALERAIALRGDRAQTHNNLGIARAETEDLEGAIEAFEIAVRLDPTHQNARRNLEVVRGMKSGRTRSGSGS